VVFLPVSTPTLSAQVINSAEACRATYGRADARYILLALGCLFGLALLIYAALPHWTTRRGRLMPITGDTMPEPAAFLEDLVRETAVAPAPTFLLYPSRWTTGGHVFGHRRHPRIQLDAGLIAMVKTNPRTVRAVVLHELAHIRARDLTATYLAVAIWRAFVAAALVPLALFTIDPGALITPTRWSWSGLGNLVQPSSVLEETTMLALAALVYLTRNAVLRARETYADSLAAQWDASDGAAALLEAVARVRRRHGPAWQYLLRKHPDPRRRQAAMLDSDAAFRVGPWDMAGIGTTLAVAADGACYLAEQAFPGNELAAWSAIGAVLALIVSATVSAALWRPTLRSTIRGLPLPRVGHLALALTAGYLLGDCLRINTFGTGGSLPQLGEPALDDAVGILLLFTALTLFAAWTTRTAAVWICAARGRSLRWALAGSTLAGWAVLAPFFSFWLPVHLIPGLAHIQWATSALAESEGWYFWHGWGISVFRAQYSPVTYWTANPLTMPCLALVVLVPFLAGVRRRYRRAGAGAETAPTWRLRAQPDAGAYPPLTRAVLRPGRALSTGFVGGVFVVVLNLILQVVVRYAVPEATQHDGGFIYYLQYAEFAGMVLAQSAVAARTALRACCRTEHGVRWITLWGGSRLIDA
jgi:Zn-dependent protease with chaperone function